MVSGSPEVSKDYQVNATPSAVVVSGGKITSPLTEGTDDIRELCLAQAAHGAPSKTVKSSTTRRASSCWNWRVPRQNDKEQHGNVTSRGGASKMEAWTSLTSGMTPPMPAEAVNSGAQA
jgi:hypothetical protein